MQAANTGKNSDMVSFGSKESNELAELTTVTSWAWRHLSRYLCPLTGSFKSQMALLFILSLSFVKKSSKLRRRHLNVHFVNNFVPHFGKVQRDKSISSMMPVHRVYKYNRLYI